MKIDLSQRRVDLDGFLGGESDSSLTIWIQVVLGCGQVRIGAFYAELPYGVRIHT